VCHGAINLIEQSKAGIGKALPVAQGVAHGKLCTVHRLPNACVAQSHLDLQLPGQALLLLPPGASPAAGCNLLSLTSTVRLIQAADTVGNYLWELNFTNYCASAVMGSNNLFGGCATFQNTDSNGLRNPYSPTTSCQTGPTLAKVTLGGRCKLLLNVGDCSNPAGFLQIAGGQRVTMYYFSSQAYQFCNYQLKFGSRSYLVWDGVASTQACTKLAPAYSPPPGYTCLVGSQYPGLIYCPPF